MFVVIVDYGSGNIKSVYNSVKKTLQDLNKFYDLKVSNNIAEIRQADKIILPGVGSFDQCIYRIRKINGLIEALNDQIIIKRKITFYTIRWMFRNRNEHVCLWL